jgi:hypothetical protein
MAEGRRTTTIAGLMTVVLIAALALAFPRLVEEPWFWAVAVAWLVGSQWVMAPIRIHRTNAFPIEKDYLPFDPSGPEVPEAIADQFRRATADLESLGFGLRGYFRPDRHSPLVIGHVGVYEDPRSGEVAKFAVAATRAKVSATLALFAKFADGTELVSSDGANLPNWPPPKWMIGQAFPGIRDAAALLEVHRARLARHGAPPVPALPAFDDGLPAHIRETAARIWETPLGLGFYTRDEAAGAYRPTWKGACLMTWGRLWPVGAIRHALRRRRAVRTLRALGMEGRLAPA